MRYSISMKIAIISDIHDNIANLKKVLRCCNNNGVNKIICCGDLASMETLNFLCDNFSGKILFTFGNMDKGYLDIKKIGPKYRNALIFENYGTIEIADKKIAFVHFPDIAKELCKSSKYDFVFYGHTHKPWEETINNCRLLNPGNVTNQRYAPTFATWNINKNTFKLILINNLPI